MWRKMITNQIRQHIMSHKAKHVNSSREKDIYWQTTVCTVYSCSEAREYIADILASPCMQSASLS